jgi:hypothetical protein
MQRSEWSTQMNKTPWIIGAVAVALIAAGAIYAKQSGDKPIDVASPGAKAVVAAVSSRIIVPQGTAFSVRLQTGLSTKTTRTGDHFDAVMASPVSVNGRVAIPAGAGVSGHVVLAEQPGKASGRGQLQLSYDQVTFGGHSYDLGTNSQVYQSASGTKKDVALIGGGAVAGGVIGAIAGTGHAAEGAAIGAAAGTGAALMTRGPQLTIEQGTVLNASLDQAVSVRRS